MLTEHPLLSEPSSVSFYNWMSNAVGNRTGGKVQESYLNRSLHNSLQTGGLYPGAACGLCFQALADLTMCGYVHQQ